MIASRPWMSAHTAAERLDVPMQQVLRMAGSGEIAARRTAGGWEISARAVEARLRVPEVVFQEPSFADPEDAMSAYLAQQPAPTYRGGPPLDLETEEHYLKERNT